MIGTGYNAVPPAELTMKTSAALTCPSPADRCSPWGTVAEHSVALVLPACTLLFLSTGPHSAASALWWTMPVWLFILADMFSPPDRARLRTDLLAWPFDALLYLLALLQLANIALMVRMVAGLAWDDASAIAASVCNLLAIRVLVGTNSCCSGIAVAHELIHRRDAFPRWLGRLLLVTVSYTHFAVEHLRSHHRHVGTREDPATAHWGESYRAYWRRTKWAQLRNAWRLENERLGLHGVVPLSSRWLRHEVLLGLLAQLLLWVVITHYSGAAGLVIFLLQSLAAVRLLEAVNYFQHWGLERASDGLDAWVTDSWFTHHAFIGLARHADHHRHGGKPYHQLSLCQHGPKLPYGYFGTAVLAKTFNRRFQRIARAELQRYRGLPPRPPEAAFTGCGPTSRNPLDVTSLP